MKNKITLLVTIFLLLASCKTIKKTNMEDTNIHETSSITEKYWKLTILEGQKVTMSENQEREIYFTLHTNENRIAGFSGCNSFSGEFTLEVGNRIRFKNIAVTMKACPDVEFNESNLLQVFELTDNYTINKDVLSLNIGRRAPLAVFEAVYMK